MSKMEGLYTKLYNKYIKLKKQKDTEMEGLNCEQDAKFKNFVAASDEMIEFLRSQNDRLGKQVSELRSEMALIRSTKDEECIQYQTLLMEENQKNKELSQEIERLRNLQREGRCCQVSDDKVDDGHLDMPGSSQAEAYPSDLVSGKMTRKRSRQSEELEHEQFKASANRSCKKTQTSDAPNNHPVCCTRKMNNSGNDEIESGSASCMFQDLVEWVVGMKLSCVAQDRAFGVSALHSSSGYSFSLTLVNNSHGEPELLYRVLSLGTFERVAPEWMRDVIIFSTHMCPTFFQRLSGVIKLNH